MITIYTIEGNRYLKGTVKISGSKNAILPIIAASILNNGITVLKNACNIMDVNLMLSILEEIGGAYVFDKDIVINCQNLSSEVQSTTPTKLRASYYYMGALLGLKGEVIIKFPGGCNIGNRKIDIHIDGFKKLGAVVTEGEYIHIKGKLTGGIVDCKKSVGATINIILASTTASGITTIINPALEPEVKETISFLNTLGYNIILDEKITIEGQKVVKKNLTFEIMPDRIETLTYVIIGLLLGEVSIINCCPKHIKEVLDLLVSHQANIEYGGNKITVKKSLIKPLHCKTSYYPGIPTDCQPLLCILLCMSCGISQIEETIYENRFKHVEELCKMGADIRVQEQTIIIKGKELLQGTKVYGSDLRGAVCLAIAGLVAQGKTTLCNTSYLERGYEDFVGKLQALGANITKKAN